MKKLIKEIKTLCIYIVEKQRTIITCDSSQIIIIVDGIEDNLKLK